MCSHPRYGLVGPNGMGKSTVMKLLARRQLPVPDNIDVLLVEQEVVGDDTSALASVVKARGDPLPISPYLVAPPPVFSLYTDH